MAELEAVIGLEIHAQISTKTKMFCRCDNDSFGVSPNVNVCPVCMGFPGMLPVLNEEALRKGIVAALALNCEVQAFSKFDRKNYFYPDSPKGFQISQFDQPISKGGWIEIQVDGGAAKKIRITRLHLEDDAGKLTHVSGGTLVDFNRAGTPLMEIVSEPDLRSASEAGVYAREIQKILRYVGASEADMEKGMMRFDASVSIREKGSGKLNARSEIKNLNSFKALENAVATEIARQTALWEAGKPQEEDFTVGWNDEKQEIYIMRSKEGSSDYRYFPEPDIPPILIGKKQIEKMRAELPEMPAVKAARFVKEYGLNEDDVKVLVSDVALADYYEKVVEIRGNAKLAASFVLTILMKHLNEELISISDQKVTAEMLGELLKMVAGGKVSNNAAKGEIFEEMYATGRSPAEILKEKGLEQISDTGEIKKVCKKVISANPQIVADFKNGKDRAIGALIGQVMKATKGKANPSVVDELIRKML
ncbi:MAG: Asp-tRNA(Asn)/Glu-tRNA(Gln) amidotransferase subunit GatB [Candidatus Gracilibacteria bacterium]